MDIEILIKKETQANLTAEQLMTYYNNIANPKDDIRFIQSIIKNKTFSLVYNFFIYLGKRNKPDRIALENLNSSWYSKPDNEGDSDIYTLKFTGELKKITLDEESEEKQYHAKDGNIYPLALFSHFEKI